MYFYTEKPTRSYTRMIVLRVKNIKYDENLCVLMLIEDNCPFRDELPPFEHAERMRISRRFQRAEIYTSTPMEWRDGTCDITELKYVICDFVTSHPGLCCAYP